MLQVQLGMVNERQFFLFVFFFFNAIKPETMKWFGPIALKKQNSDDLTSLIFWSHLMSQQQGSGTIYSVAQLELRADQPTLTFEGKFTTVTCRYNKSHKNPAVTHVQCSYWRALILYIKSLIWIPLWCQTYRAILYQLYYLPFMTTQSQHHGMLE